MQGGQTDPKEDYPQAMVETNFCDCSRIFTLAGGTGDA